MKKLIYVICCLAIFTGTLHSQVMTQEMLKSMSPNEALTKLKEGNTRFHSDQMLDRNWELMVQTTAKGQYPFAVILSCMDSRTSSEIIFDQGIGDIFNNRIAGNIINDDILGSMEYACAVVGSKLVVIMGHSECGAVKGAIDNVELGNLTGLLHKIDPAVESTSYDGDRTAKDHTFVELVTEENVRLAMEEVRQRSSILREMEEKGQIAIVGGLYNVSTGTVIFYE